MRVIGITGSIACGKTTVTRALSSMGYPVVDGDVLSRELTGPGGSAMEEIRAVFGDRYIQQDGSLNRREMGRLVFSDRQARERLDRLMAPYLRALTLRRIESIRSSGARLCFLDMPLLYEKGYDQYCDTVWCIWLPEDLQLRRLMDRDGFTRDEALSRMNAVMSSDEKANLAPVVIDNSGPVDDTLQQVDEQLSIELSRTECISRCRRSSPPDPLPDQLQQAVPPPYAPTPVAIERNEATRKKPSGRKTSWRLPSPIKITLICLAAVLAVSFTAQMLMNAYLTRRLETHRAEQEAIDEQYPLMYEDAIRKTASEYNLSPFLIAAVIRNESSFRPSAESAVGAR